MGSLGGGVGESDKAQEHVVHKPKAKLIEANPSALLNDPPALQLKLHSVSIALEVKREVDALFEVSQPRHDPLKRESHRIQGLGARLEPTLPRGADVLFLSLIHI